MGIIEILLIAVGLSMDAFAVSLGIGAGRKANTPGPIFRLSFSFGLFQAMMPIIGWYAGNTVAGLISGVDHWLALALLAFVGGRMIHSGLDPNGESITNDPSLGLTLLMLSIATSIDALAIGFSLAMLKVQIFYPAAIIGVVTGSLSLIGLLLGNKLGKAFGKRMEIFGGLVLIGIGLRILVSHLFGIG
jgi:manganese efflux pump family protein